MTHSELPDPAHAAGDPRETPAWRPPSAAAVSLDPGLYVVSTPIGNLRDMTLRGLDVLAGADVVLAEDTRVTRKLLDAFGIAARPLSLHDHNEAEMRPRVLEWLAAGRRVALVSDAGTPLVSDPGYKLVAAALDAGARVFPVPGASALLAGLVAAGLPTDRFLFAGFPPAKAGARARFLESLAAVDATLVLYETGPRLAESLAAMAHAFGPRLAVVARELTKLFEETRRAPLPDLVNAYAEGGPRGEIVVIVAPPAPPAAVDPAEIDAALRALLAEHPVKVAAGLAAERFAIPRREAYARALALKDAP